MLNVDLVWFNAGGGHRAAAQALEQVIHAQGRPWRVRKVNLTEVLERLSSLIRGRFRFQRKVKTLSAEGRMSAWVLVAVPFVLATAIVLSSPTYLPLLIKEPLGQKLVIWAFVAMLIGIFWIRKIIRIQV